MISGIFRTAMPSRRIPAAILVAGLGLGYPIRKSEFFALNSLRS